MKRKSIDFDAMQKGTIPWSAEECIEVMGWYHKLLSTPKDDWDLGERGFSLKDKKGKIIRVTFNQFMPVNQLGFHMVRRYSGMPYHLYRFMEIIDFLREHYQQLRIAGFIKPGGKGYNMISIPVLQALCELPFSKKVVIKKESSYTFDYQEVIQRANELLKKDHEGG